MALKMMFVMFRSSSIDSELLQICDWLSVNRLSLNVEKTRYMIFHNYQRVIANEDFPDLNINDKNIVMGRMFQFFRLNH